jgi:hypothetical protein
MVTRQDTASFNLFARPEPDLAAGTAQLSGEYSVAVAQATCFF